jgi:hypothetical protein
MYPHSVKKEEHEPAQCWHVVWIRRGQVLVLVMLLVLWRSALWGAASYSINISTQVMSS